MILVVRVKLVLKEDPGKLLKGVKLALYDRDQADEDDFLASGLTGENGQARLVFDSDQYTDKEDQPAWRLDSMPDLYVNVFDKDEKVIYSTREQAEVDKMPDLITVALPQSLAEQHQLFSD
jgi:hypothetical protein